MLSISQTCVWRFANFLWGQFFLSQAALFEVFLRVSIVKTVFGNFRRVESDANATGNRRESFIHYSEESVGGRNWRLDNPAIWLLAQGNEPAVFKSGSDLPDLSPLWRKAAVQSGAVGNARQLLLPPALGGRSVGRRQQAGGRDRRRTARFSISHLSFANSTWKCNTYIRTGSGSDRTETQRV